jgi:hypothetical protein
MDRFFSMLTGMGLGACLMYILDPQLGRRRRALARDQFVKATRQTQEAAKVTACDVRNRAQGLASGDLSVLVGGKRAWRNPLQGGWSPSGRALLAGFGTGLFVYGLTRRAPEACVVGTIGLALVAEGITNLGVSDVTNAAGNLAEKAKGLLDGRAGATKNMASSEVLPVAAGI